MPGSDERKAGKPVSDPGPTANASSGEQAPPEPPPRDPPRDLRLPLAEILKRGLSAGRDVSESLFPREFANNLASQLVDARHGLVNAIAVEVGRFLRQADIASEMRKVLAGLNIEAKIQLRFSEDESGNLRSQMDVEREPRPSPFSRKTPKPPPPEGS